MKAFNFTAEYEEHRRDLEVELELLQAEVENYEVTENQIGMVDYRHVIAMKKSVELLRQANARLRRAQEGESS